MQNFLYFLCRYGNVSQVPESQDRLAGFRIFPDLKETAEVRINDVRRLTCSPARIINGHHHHYHHLLHDRYGMVGVYQIFQAANPLNLTLSEFVTYSAEPL